MRIAVTENIPDAAVDQLAADWAPFARIDERERFMFRSVEPPTILQIVASLLEWSTALKVAAIAFATQLGKSAAEDAWKNKSEIGHALKDHGTRVLLEAASALTRVGSSVPRPLQILVGLDYPDPHWPPSFQLPVEDPEIGAAMLAALVLKGGRIQDLLREHESLGHGPLGPVNLTISGSGAVLVRWMDREGKEYLKEV